jgi:hypothetical protein
LCGPPKNGEWTTQRTFISGVARLAAGHG